MRAPQIMIMAAALALGATAAAEPDKRKSRIDLDACAKAFAGNAPDDAVARCTAAVTEWPANHRAWYVLGLVHTARDWTAAAEALSHAVELRPDDAMYQAWAGVARYEKALAGATTAGGVVDEATINYELAQAHLERAIALDGGLWRAQFYLGRIYRAAGKDKRAAEAFTQAIISHADLAPAYIALAELYRKWGYLREAADVATAGTKHVTDPVQRSEVWFTLGAAQLDAHNDDAALEALHRALEDRPQLADAHIQRGVALYRKGELAKAKAELEQGLAGDLPPDTRAAATQLLQEIARRKK